MKEKRERWQSIHITSLFNMDGCVSPFTSVTHTKFLASIQSVIERIRFDIKLLSKFSAQFQFQILYSLISHREQMDL